MPKACAFLVVSLGCNTFSPHYLDQCLELAASRDLALTILLLDKEEPTNRSILNQEPISITHTHVCRQVKALIPHIGNRGQVTRSSELLAEPGFVSLQDSVYEAYSINRRLKNFVHNEVFRNLDPQLRSIGAKNSRDPRITTLAPYLLHELSVYGWLAQTGRYRVEIGPRKRPSELFREFFSSSLTRELDKIEYLSQNPSQRVPTLRLTNVTCRTSQLHYILNKINIDINVNRVSGLIGPNGSGKSTLLKIIAGHIPVSEGNIWINGVDVTKSAPRKRQISTVFQHPILMPGHTVKGNLKLFLSGGSLPKQKRDLAFKEVVDIFGFEDVFLAKPADALSGGETQRVAIARSFLSGATLLLMDEPGSALDIASRIQLLRAVTDLIKDCSKPYYPRTAFIVAHDPDLVSAICDEVVVLNDGRLIATGQVESLLRNPNKLTVSRHLCPANTFFVDSNESSLNIGERLVELKKTFLSKVSGANRLSCENKETNCYLYVPAFAIALSKNEHWFYAGDIYVTGIKRRINGFEVFFHAGANEDKSINVTPDLSAGEFATPYAIENKDKSITVAYAPNFQSFPVKSPLSIDLPRCAFIFDH